MKNDLISRQEAIDAIDRERKEKHLFNTAEDGLLEARRVINTLSSVGTERKTAEWIYGENSSGQDGWFCSECNFFEPWYYEFYGLGNIDFIRDYHTCPGCDAKMITYTGMGGKHE